MRTIFVPRSMLRAACAPWAFAYCASVWALAPYAAPALAFLAPVKHESE